jgi:hypothetical protein
MELPRSLGCPSAQIGVPPGVVALDAEGFRPTQKEKAGAALHPQLTGPKGTVRPVGYSFHPPQRVRGAVPPCEEGGRHDFVGVWGEPLKPLPVINCAIGPALRHFPDGAGATQFLDNLASGV